MIAPIIFKPAVFCSRFAGISTRAAAFTYGRIRTVSGKVWFCFRGGNMRNWLQRWGPSLLMMGLIFAASSTPGHDLPNFGQWNFDIYKAGHMMGYALLAMAYLHGLANSRPITLRLMLLSILLAGLYAITDEWHQRFTAGRNSTSLDVLIDSAGAAIGVMLWTWARFIRSTRLAGGQK
jgi:hypothetical protein